jgi:hypothetical protein
MQQDVVTERTEETVEKEKQKQKEKAVMVLPRTRLNMLFIYIHFQLTHDSAHVRTGVRPMGLKTKFNIII